MVLKTNKPKQSSPSQLNTRFGGAPEQLVSRLDQETDKKVQETRPSTTFSLYRILRANRPSG